MWVAPTYHQQLTASIFLKNFPDWTRSDFLEVKMRELQAAFEQRGVRCCYRSQREDKQAARRERRALRGKELHTAREELTGTQMTLEFCVPPRPIIKAAVNINVNGSHEQ